MRAGSRTVTGVIRTLIPVIGTGRGRRIKAAVRIFLAGVTLRLRTGIPRVYGTGPGAAGVGAVAENAVITGSGVVGMGTGPRTVTGVIRARIAVISTDRACRIKTAVRIFLAGVALRPGTGTSRVERAGARPAGIRTVAVEAVITGIGVVGVLAHVSYTGVIRTDIQIITICRVYTLKCPHFTRLWRHLKG